MPFDNKKNRRINAGIRAVDLRMWRNGRRARLRIWCRKAWGFKSLHPHQSLLIKIWAGSRHRCPDQKPSKRQPDINYTVGMDFTTREISSTRQAIDINLTREEFEPYVEDLTKRAQKKANIKGFRPGHVPKSLVKKYYGEELEEDAVEQAIQKVFVQILKENENLRPFSQPMLTRADVTGEGAVEATIVYDVLPEFELGQYKGLRAQRVYHVVSDEEIGFELDRLRERGMTTEEAEQATDEGHIVTIDLYRVEDNVVLFDNPIRDVEVYLRRGEVNKDLKELLLNTKINDTFRISLPTGEDEAMTLYQVTVKKIDRANLPQLDDAFASALMDDVSATLDTLKDAIRDSILFEYTQRYSRSFRDDIVGQIVSAHQFDVPESLVHSVLDSFLDDLRNRYKDQKLPYNFDQKKFHDEMHPLAENTARWALIRDRIVQAEGLVPEEADFLALAEMEAQRANMEVDKILELMMKSPQVADRIVSEKALQLVEDYAIAHDVLDTELVKQEQQQAEAEAAEKPAAEEPKKLITL